MKWLSLLLLTTSIVFRGAEPVNAGSKSSSTNHIFNILRYGAVGNGLTKNTKAIQKTIEACVKAGGGTVWVPAGKFLTGPINLKSNMTLHVDAGARLLFSQDVSDYRTVQSRWYGIEQHGFSPCIFAEGCENISITGRGIIDGQGLSWWKLFRQKPQERPKYVRKRRSEFMRLTREKFGHEQTRFGRPQLVQFRNCRNVLIEGVTLTRAAFWVLCPLYCENVTIDAVTITSPPDSPNTDALGIDSCRNVRVSNCYFVAGDDCIVIKAGRDKDGRRVNRPSENIVITNCIMAQGHGGVVIGSEMSAGVKNVVIDNCIFTGTDRGIRLKSRRGRGGLVEDIRVNNIIMKDVLCPFTINMFYFKPVDDSKSEVTEGTPVFRNIHFSNITVRNANYGGFFTGLPELPVERITFSNVYIDATKGRAREKSGGSEEDYNHIPAMADGYDIVEGFFCKNIKDIEFHNVQVDTKRGPAFIFENVENLEIDGFKTGTLHSSVPAIELRQVKAASIDTQGPFKAKGPFIKISGAETRDIFISDKITRHKEAVIREADVGKDALVH